MLKAYFTDLSAYNSWANYKAMDWLCQIDDEQWERANVSSFSSVKKNRCTFSQRRKDLDRFLDYGKESSLSLFRICRH